jgi:putative aminopeptidase FrvX
VKDDPALAGVPIRFAATASEEVGGEGALFLLHESRPAVCVALEIGPRGTPDADFPLDATPTVWVTDAYATMDPRDADLIEDAARDAGLVAGPHWQAVSRGGSDASCAASRGLCARPVTLAFGAENSHGFEIMHRDAPENLARLLVAYLRRLGDPSA